MAFVFSQSDLLTANEVYRFRVVAVHCFRVGLRLRFRLWVFSSFSIFWVLRAMMFFVFECFVFDTSSAVKL